MADCNSIYGNIAGCAPTITLPGSQGDTGATGATGSDGAAILNNDRTRNTDLSTVDLQVLHTYTMDNTPDEVLDTLGDSIYIETGITVKAGVSGVLTLEFGALTNTLQYTINTPLLADTEFVLSLFITRTSLLLNTQDCRSKICISGQPDTSWTLPLSTLTQDLTADITINSKVQKDAAGSAADVTGNYLLVTKYKTV